ncbi:MAG: MazG family protein [Acidimicrobiales bacterium]
MGPDPGPDRGARIADPGVHDDRATAGRGMSLARVVIVGLGPAGADLVTAGTLDAIDRVPHRFLRTARHPSAHLVSRAATFDWVYEGATDLDDVYPRIVDALVEAAAEHGEVLYAVPGSPAVAERTVELLRTDRRVEVDEVPALSFVDLAWNRLGVDPVAAGVRLVDGHRFGVEAAGERGPLLVAQCDQRRVLSDVKLAIDADMAPGGAAVLQRLGLPDEFVAEVRWEDLDRTVEPDHLTSLWVPRLAAPVAGEVARFAALVRTLRERCPWDREQTHQTLTRHLLEETYEVLDAIESLDEATGAGDEHLEEELGDLLIQVVFHATLGAERGAFTLADVARGIHHKLVARHPHVFGDVEASTADHVIRNWEQIKRVEQGRDSVMDGIPSSLPSLLYAHKVQRKAATLGIEAPVPESAGLLESESAVGEALFGLVAAARRLDVDPESALRAAAARFREQVRARERGLEGPPDFPA